LEAAWAVTEHLDQTIHYLAEFVVMFEGWFPLGEVWNNFIKAITSDNFTEVVDSSLYFSLADSAGVAVETAVTDEAG